MAYLAGDKTKDEEGNVITELNFHCMVSFVDYEQLILGMETLCNRHPPTTHYPKLVDGTQRLL